MQIEPLKQEDLSAVMELQPDDWGDIQPALEFYTRSAYCFPVKVSMSGRIVGISTRIHHEDVAWLGHIIVHKDFRRQGIGLQIMEHLVAATNCATINLLKELGFFLPGFGEGLIIAVNKAAGLALMQKRIATHDKIAFPANNEVARQYLYRLGAKEVSVGKRMRLGAVRKLKLQNIYSRIGGNLG